MNVDVKFDKKKIEQKVTNDKFGLFVSNEWKRLIDPYTPRDTGVLMGVTGQTVDIQPFKLHYKSKYAEIVYENSKGFKFITQGSGRNPCATDHWDIKAAQCGQLNKLYRTLNNALKSGKF